MTDCTNDPASDQLIFAFAGRRRVTVTCSEDELSNDAGVLLLRHVDERWGLTSALADALSEWRNPLFIVHSLQDLTRERIFAIAQGYEDGNDAAQIRQDTLFKIACGRNADGVDLASQPSISRFENYAGRDGLIAAKGVLLEHFIRKNHRRLSRGGRVVLDMDTTDDPTHGQQEFAFFNGYYDSYCYQELLIHSEEGDLLWCELLPGTDDARGPALRALTYIVERLRLAFPKITLALRADAGFAGPEMYDYCEDEHLEYAINGGTYEPWKQRVVPLLERAESLHQASDATAPVQVFGEFSYQAKSWRQPRRIVAKAQRTPLGPDQRFLVTNLSDAPDVVYRWYSGRGQSENFIKDLKRGLKSDRLSCSSHNANELRLVLFCVAYQLMHELRRQIPSEPRLQLDTLRLRFLRVAARVQVTARRVWVRLSRTYPWRHLWQCILTYA
jgi:hypothetical protein